MTPHVLLITSKWNSPSYGIDGGSMTAADVVESLYGKVELDILTSKHFSDSIPSEYYNKLYTYDLSYKSDYSNKFELRKSISYAVAMKLRNLKDHYDRIVVIHIFHALYFNEVLLPSDYRKIVLFPMFLSPSYGKSNEKVPDWYFEMEQNIIPVADNIITPSVFEKEQLINDFKAKENSIHVIPRMVSSSFIPIMHYSLSPKNILITCTSSFRKQKRLNLSIDLLEQLKERGIYARLFLVGSIQDKEEYTCFLHRLNRSSLSSTQIQHIEYMSQRDLNKLYSKADFGVSFSSCETFGRAIMESLSSGLPNIILDETGDLSSLIGDNHGAVFCPSIKDMCLEIEKLVNNTGEYIKLGEYAINYRKHFVAERIKPMITNAILK